MSLPTSRPNSFDSGWLAAQVSSASRTTDEWRAEHMEAAARRLEKQSEVCLTQASNYRDIAANIRARLTRSEFMKAKD